MNISIYRASNVPYCITGKVVSVPVSCIYIRFEKLNKNNIQYYNEIKGFKSVYNSYIRR